LNKLKFAPVCKDRLFYDRYEYCMGFYLDEVSCLRQLDHTYIDDTMERRKQWREITQQRWINGRQKHGVILRRTWRDITEKTVTDLHALAEQLLTTKVDYKLVVSINQGHIYTNDLDLIGQLSAMSELTNKTYTQAQVSRPKNTIVLKNPQYQFRTYFKLMKLTVQQKDQLMDFLHGQQGHVRLSPGLGRWFDSSFNRCQDYFFVDHNTESWLTMLSLVHPGIVRKTMHIIPAK
jgi:hypothetical protein